MCFKSTTSVKLFTSNTAQPLYFSPWRTTDRACRIKVEKSQAFLSHLIQVGCCWGRMPITWKISPTKLDTCTSNYISEYHSIVYSETFLSKKIFMENGCSWKNVCGSMPACRVILLIEKAIDYRAALSNLWEKICD